MRECPFVSLIKNMVWKPTSCLADGSPWWLVIQAQAGSWWHLHSHWARQPPPMARSQPCLVQMSFSLTLFHPCVGSRARTWRRSPQHIHLSPWQETQFTLISAFSASLLHLQKKTLRFLALILNLAWVTSTTQSCPVHWHTIIARLTFSFNNGVCQLILEADTLI